MSDGADGIDGVETPRPRHTGVAGDDVIPPSAPGATTPATAPSAPAPVTVPGPDGSGDDGSGAAPGTPGGGASEPGGAASAPPVNLPGRLHTEGSSILTATGETHVIKAAAWFGMETSNCAPHGLWSISLDAGLAQIASMGFNSIRLPFSNECLASPVTTSISAQANPDLVSLTPLQLMDTVIARAASYGLTVMLDRHRPDSGSQSALWYTDRYPEAAWIADWTMLAERYRDQPAVIGFDLHNEPHGEACWGCGDPATDWQAAATRAGDAVLAVDPTLLIVVEGVERQGDGTSTWWGGGLADAGAAPVSLSVPGQLVYSPHDYPKSIYPQAWFDAPDYPANLPALWDANWGYLATGGTAPVLLGEFGSRLETDADRAWFETMVAYLASRGLSFSYWSFNPNSGDTGGLVGDDWVTPQAEKLAALAPLIGTGSAVTPSAPAPAPAPGPTSTPTPTPIAGGPGAPSGATDAPGTSPAPAPTPVPGDARPEDDDGDEIVGDHAASEVLPWVAPLVAEPGVPWVLRVPSPDADGDVDGEGLETELRPEPATTEATAEEGRLNALWTLQSSWETGYVAEVAVTNSGGSSGWRVSWADPAATAVVGSWGMSCVLAEGRVTCIGSDWAELVAPGQTVEVGVQVTAPTAPQAPALSVTAR